MSVDEISYITSTTDRVQRLNRITQIITALENQAIVAAGDSNIQEYMVDDSQIKIKTLYRSPEEIYKAIRNFEKIQIQLQSQLNGTRIIRLADAKAIKSNRFYKKY